MTQADVEFDPDAADDADGDEQQDSPRISLPRDQVRSWQRDAKAGRKAMQELAELRRTQGLTSAGLTLNEAQQRAFDRDYEGDYSVESLQQYAAEMGWQVTGAPSQDAQDMAALDRVNAASAGSAAPTPPHSFNDELRRAAGRA